MQNIWDGSVRECPVQNRFSLTFYVIDIVYCKCLI